jgi:hypothetical protein
LTIPTYKEREENGTASTNQEKGHVLASNFFLKKPYADESLSGHKYPKVCSCVGKITQEQI